MRRPSGHHSSAAAADEYRGTADHRITRARCALDVPVIASGDITTRRGPTSAEATGAAAVMIGRAGLRSVALRAMATGARSSRPDLSGVITEIQEFAAEVIVLMENAVAFTICASSTRGTSAVSLCRNTRSPSCCHRGF